MISQSRTHAIHFKRHTWLVDVAREVTSEEGCHTRFQLFRNGLGGLYVLILLKYKLVDKSSDTLEPYPHFFSVLDNALRLPSPADTGGRAHLNDRPFLKCRTLAEECNGLFDAKDHVSEKVESIFSNWRQYERGACLTTCWMPGQSLRPARL